MKKIDLHNDPKLESGFKIPDHYFDSFEDKLMNRIENIDTTPKTITLKAVWRKKQIWIGSVAAVLLISLGIVYFISNEDKQFQTSTQDYLAYDSDLTIDDLAEHLTEDDIQKLEKEITIVDNTTEKYINEYLN